MPRRPSLARRLTTAAVSHRARAGNPLVRLGFRALGRREQLKFYSHACEQMARLTAVGVRSAAA